MSDVTTTDLYEVTMALSYLREDVQPASLSLFVRQPPPGRGFLVAGSGLEPAWTSWRATAWSGRTSRSSRPPCTVRYETSNLSSASLLRERYGAVPEGHAVFAGEPLLEVTAPLPQAQLVETYLLNQVCHDGRGVPRRRAASWPRAKRPVVDFLRCAAPTAHGPGHQAARLGALVGFAGTGDITAATALGIPASGTMAHSYIEAFPDEEEAFRAFAHAHPGPVASSSTPTTPRKACALPPGS